MTSLKRQLKSLSPAQIDASPQIKDWLSQFDENQRTLAKVLLSRLQFISRDTFAEWLNQAFTFLPKNQILALYSVRKLTETKNQDCYWDDDGNPVVRPGASLGSEDLVYSLISNLVRAKKEILLDHPTLNDLREKKVRSYVLIDDSIGSGKRVADFINAMLKHPTFLSWWNFGWIKICVLSFARTRESEAYIISHVRGKDHNKQKIKKVEKITFFSEIVYSYTSCKDCEKRWGKKISQLKELCQNQAKIPPKKRLGYGDVLGNIVFYHSVPNHLPGVLWFTKKKVPQWYGLFPDRALPKWLLDLLDTMDSKISGVEIADELLELLALSKRGIRNPYTFALRLNVDTVYAQGLLSQAKYLGLVTDNNRLTGKGLDQLRQSIKRQALPKWDYSLYIPDSWCADRATIQPSMHRALADSVKVSACTDGDVGQISLEKTDAKAAKPPISVMVPAPMMPWANPDTDGPPRSKER